MLNKTILITAFGIFDGYLHNPTVDIAMNLRGRAIDSYRVEALVLPVSYRKVVETLPRILEELRPSIAIGLGFAPRATRVVLELVASRIASFSIPDNDGYRPVLDYVPYGDSLAIETTLPIEDIVKVCIERKKLRLALGVSIGTYLCGVAGYIIMSYAKKHGVYGGFLHIPPTTDIAMRYRFENYIPLNEVIEIIECVLRTCIEKLER